MRFRRARADRSKSEVADKVEPRDDVDLGTDTDTDGADTDGADETADGSASEDEPTDDAADARDSDDSDKAAEEASIERDDLDDADESDSEDAAELDDPATAELDDPATAEVDDPATDDADGSDDSDDSDEQYDDPEPTGRFAWLKPRKRRIDYGPDFTVRVATLPDLERFPEDGHVHPEIVRSWMALQQFGEAMLLVSWVDRSPAGYVLVSWTGDWDDDVRAAHPDTPALCNLWADERYADDDVEQKLVKAAITVCQKQGKKGLLATLEPDNEKVRAELEGLGFEPTDLTTEEKYVYLDSEGKKRRGIHQNVVLLKEI